MGSATKFEYQPHKLVDALIGIPFEPKCALNMLLHLMSAHDGRLPDRDRYVAGILDLDVRVWLRHKRDLVQRDLITVANGHIHSPIFALAFREWRVRNDWHILRKAVIKRDGTTCRYCRRPAEPIEIDHVIPRSRGGLSTMDNLVVACMACNRSKGGRTPDEWTGGSPL